MSALHSKPVRKIIHVDMDAFFASVEQRDFPEYRNKPLIVGGKPNERGVVAACSYEARQFGIHSAMPCSIAYRLCPKAIFVPHRFGVYRAISQQIREIFSQYATDVEPLSLDEAYLDVTEQQAYQGSATYIAKVIRQAIFGATGLTASAGVSYNKFLAKMASDINKPNGLYTIRPEEGPAFIAQLPIGQFHGVGPATEAKMLALGIKNGADLKQWRRDDLRFHFGKVGYHFYDIARGVDERPVCSQRQRRSIGKEQTFQNDIKSLIQVKAILSSLAQQVWQNLQPLHYQARTITIKVKYANFRQVTRAKTYEQAITEDVLLSAVEQLIEKAEIGVTPIRLLGVSLSGFGHFSVAQQGVQLPLSLDTL